MPVISRKTGIDKEELIRFVVNIIEELFEEDRHASWLNQVEIGFSVLSWRALKRASFASPGNLW